MRIKSVLNLALVFVFAQLLFACNSAKYYDFGATKGGAYGNVKKKPAPVAPAKELNLAEIALAASALEAEENTAEPVLEAKVTEASELVVAPAPAPKVAKITTPANTETNKLTEAEAMAMAKERIASMTKAEKKELKKEVRKAFRQSSTTTSIVEIILAIILPPLAVFLHDGIGTSFWINIILTLLFFLPGIIHALLVVTDTI
ncbi:YqaE/Pmp3 family membrane protein [Pontibacter harenae]|uniref:YqaE/Pmp3 family membrane protein n=1 Tax=Pontibacter harenae TaxID=2894083 RepID=UPI003F6F1CF3